MQQDTSYRAAQNRKLVFQRPAGVSVNIRMVPTDQFGNDLSAGGVITLADNTAYKIVNLYEETFEFLPEDWCDFRFSTDQSLYFCRAGTTDVSPDFAEGITPTLANMAELPATFYGMLSEIN
jgi:hypothetical protein